MKSTSKCLDLFFILYGPLNCFGIAFVNYVKLAPRSSKAAGDV